MKTVFFETKTVRVKFAFQTAFDLNDVKMTPFLLRSVNFNSFLNHIKYIIAQEREKKNSANSYIKAMKL
jgi:hypothetical protein